MRIPPPKRPLIRYPDRVDVLERRRALRKAQRRLEEIRRMTFYPF